MKRVERPVADYLTDLGRLVRARERGRGSTHQAWLTGLRPKFGITRKWYVVIIREQPSPIGSRDGSDG